MKTLKRSRGRLAIAILVLLPTCTLGCGLSTVAWLFENRHDTPWPDVYLDVAEVETSSEVVSCGDSEIVFWQDNPHDRPRFLTLEAIENAAPRERFRTMWLKYHIKSCTTRTCGIRIEPHYAYCKNSVTRVGFYVQNRSEVPITIETERLILKPRKIVAVRRREAPVGEEGTALFPAVTTYEVFDGETVVFKRDGSATLMRSAGGDRVSGTKPIQLVTIKTGLESFEIPAGTEAMVMLWYHVDSIMEADIDFYFTREGNEEAEGYRFCLVRGEADR